MFGAGIGAARLQDLEPVSAGIEDEEPFLVEVAFLGIGRHGIVDLDSGRFEDLAGRGQIVDLEPQVIAQVFVDVGLGDTARDPQVQFVPGVLANAKMRPGGAQAVGLLEPLEA